MELNIEYIFILCVLYINDIGDDLMNNHMEIPWHDYTNKDSKVKIENASLTEKSSIIGRIGLMLLACGTGAWRVRSSMNTIASELNITCIADIGLTNISYTCTPNPCLYIIQVSIHPSLLVWKTLSITLKTNVKHAHATKYMINLIKLKIFTLVTPPLF